jgi:ATP-dependent exoDNAse (exonuclease V) alpha subunit
MASFHLSVKTVSRSTGRSAVAAAAYRQAVSLEDERTGIEHDYTRKQGVEDGFVIVPEGAEWAQNRGALWNAAEGAEKRKDAKTAREYELALPAELDASGRRALAESFAREISARYGVAVDVAIHAPHRDGDQRNYHAHMLTTTRAVTPEGMGAKTRQLDVRDTAALEVEALRARWADLSNAALMEIGSPERVDHRSLKRQGTLRVPEQHMGPQASAMERRARQRATREQRAYQPVTRIGAMNAVIKEYGLAITREIAAEISKLREYVSEGTAWIREKQRQLAQRVAPVVERVTDYFGGADITALAAGAGGKMQADDRARFAREQERTSQGKQREGPQRTAPPQKEARRPDLDRDRDKGPER